MEKPLDYNEVKGKKMRLFLKNYEKQQTKHNNIITYSYQDGKPFIY